MNQQTISLLKNYLYQDQDFKSVFDKRFPQTFILEYGNAVDRFIDSMNYESLLDFYLLDKKYLDISWIQINGDLIHGDNLYHDWKSFIQNYQR